MHTIASGAKFYQQFPSFLASAAESEPTAQLVQLPAAMEVNPASSDALIAAKLRQETEELQQMLRELQGSASEFRKECARDNEAGGATSSSSRPPSLAKNYEKDRREKAQSSWAKSATPRRSPGFAQSASDVQEQEAAQRAFNEKHGRAILGAKLAADQLPNPPAVYDVARAEAYTKTRAASIAMPRASRGESDSGNTQSAQIAAVEKKNMERFVAAQKDHEWNGARCPKQAEAPSFFANGGTNHYVPDLVGTDALASTGHASTVPVPAKLEVADNLLSNRKRPRATEFSKAVRLTGPKTETEGGRHHMTTRSATGTSHSSTAPVLEKENNPVGSTLDSENSFEQPAKPVSVSSCRVGASMTKEQWRQAKLEAALAESQKLLEEPIRTPGAAKGTRGRHTSRKGIATRASASSAVVVGMNEVAAGSGRGGKQEQMIPTAAPDDDDTPVTAAITGSSAVDDNAAQMDVQDDAGEGAGLVASTLEGADDEHATDSSAMGTDPASVAPPAPAPAPAPTPAPDPDPDPDPAPAPDPADAYAGEDIGGSGAKGVSTISADAAPARSKKQKVSTPTSTYMERPTSSGGFSFGTAPRRDPMEVFAPKNGGFHPAVVRAAALTNATDGASASSARAVAAARLLEGLQQQPLGYDVSKADAFTRRAVVGVPVLRVHASPVPVPAPVVTPPAPPSNEMTSAAKSDPVLSYQVRAPVAVMRAPIDRNALLPPAAAQAMAVSKTIGTPGPGAYDGMKAKPGFDSNSSNKGGRGKVYHAPVKKAAATQLYIGGKSQVVTPGPGDYDVLGAEASLKHTPGTRIVAPAESKTPQLMRKKYWEDKAADLRLEHDNQVDANETLLSNRRRTTDVKIAIPESERLSRMDERSILVRRKREAQLEAEAEAQAERELVGVNRKLVEARSKVAVNMSVEGRAAEARRQFLLSKPGVSSVLAERKIGDKAKDRVYGPSLQVQWGGGDEGMPDEGYESPGTELKRMLKRKDAGLPVLDDSNYETTEAFLRSSHAVPRASTAVDMNAPKHQPDPRIAQVLAQRKLDARREKGLESDVYVPPDALDDLASKPGLAVKFDLSHGRDSIKVLGKDQTIVSTFNDYKISAFELDPHGPGALEGLEEARDAVGKGSKAKGVAFSRLVSREDAIGPNGEAPISAQEAFWMAAMGAGDEGADYEELLMQEMLDLDYGISKDKYLELKKKSKTFKLYERERHEERDKKEAADHDDPRNDHLGGSYYEEHTLVNEAAKSNLQDFDKRPGRAADKGAKAAAASEEDKLMDEILQKDFEIGFVGGKHSEPARVEGQELDLEVKETNPMMPKPVDLSKFDDLEKYPRWKEKKKIRKPKVADYLKDGTAFKAKEDYEDDADFEKEEKEIEYDSFDEDARPELDVTRASKYMQKHTQVPVKMDTQVGRSDVKGDRDQMDDIERELMRDMGLDEYAKLPSEAQTEAMMKLEKDRSAHVNRAIELTSKNLRVNPVALVDMSNDRGRGEAKLNAKATEVAEKAQQSELDRALRKDYDDFGKNANNAAGHWGSAEGRNTQDDDNEQIQDLIQNATGLPSDHPKTLDLQPNLESIKPKSRLTVVPEMTKTLHEPRIRDEGTHLNTHLEYGDPDPQMGRGKGGRGLAPMKQKGEHTTGRAMHNEVGRGAISKHDDEIMKKELGEFHDEKETAGNVLVIDSRAAEASTKVNVRGGSMAGVSGRKDVRVKDNKAKEAKAISKKELDALLSSAGNFKARVNEKEIEEKNAKLNATKALPPSQTNPALKAALKSASAIDKKNASIRFRDIQEAERKSQAAKEKKDKLAESKAASAVKASSKANSNTKTKPVPKFDGSLNVNTSNEYNHGDGMGNISSPVPLTPLNVKAPKVSGSTPAPKASSEEAASDARIDDMMKKLGIE